MVFLTECLLKYMPKHLIRGIDSHTTDKRFFRRMMLFRMTKNFSHRDRNCYKLALNSWTKSLEIARDGRAEKKMIMRDLYSQRIWAATKELDLEYKYFLGILPQMGIELDRKVLSHMSIFEPRTFEALVELCRAKVAHSPVGTKAEQMTKPDGVQTRNML